MKDTKKLIKDIYWQVWYFNNFYDKYEDWHTPLMDDTDEIAPIVKNYCETIIKAKSEKSKLVKDAIENIYKYCRPANYTQSAMNAVHANNIDTDKESRLQEMPKFVADILLEDINELIDSVKSEGDISLQELNDKWKHKWLFFNGDESGQQIIRINKIHYHDEELVFNGSMINFVNENNSEGVGVIVSEVENEFFANLHYIDYIEKGKYDYEANDDEEYSGEWINPKKLDAALSSKPIDTDLKSRILTDEEVKEMIIDTFYNEDYGVIEEKCYDM